MTEAEWLACADPMDLHIFLGDKIDERKYRLFGCACVRGVWRDLPADDLRQAIEVCERYADGLATVEELGVARGLAHDKLRGTGNIIADHSAIAVEALCRPRPWFPMGEGSAAGIAAVAAEAWSNSKTPYHVANSRAKRSHCQLFRDIFGNPFRSSPRLPPRILAWNDRTVPRLAQAIYEERNLPKGTLDTARLTILADALLDAGCDNEDLIQNCRSDGPHVRGCWAVDLILGKS